MVELLLRDEIQERERETLAPYAFPSSESRGRVHAEPEQNFHTPFQRDRERVIHSRAFRRLQYKTQVFVNHEGDYYRTRLTHTIEVGQMARTVARTLRLNVDLCETIALAHDLGHPPFGHAGERALAKLLAEHGGFEHNAQALRLVDLLERRYTLFRGLNLSYEVREGIWKRRDTPTCRHLGYVDTFDLDQAPLLEAQVADLVDSICYDHHDLDDALKSGLLHPSELDGIELWDEACAAVQASMVALGPAADTAERVRRQEIVRYLRHQQVRDLIQTTRDRLQAHGVDSLEAVRQAQEPLVGLSPEAKRKKRELQEFLFHKVYRHYRVVRLVEKARRVIHRLFEAFCEAPKQLPDEYREWVDAAGLERGVADYIAGMTDRYAQHEYRKLFRPFEPM